MDRRQLRKEFGRAGAEVTLTIAADRGYGDGSSTRDEHNPPDPEKPFGRMELLLFTGLRRSDAVRLGRQHRKGGYHAISTKKSREMVTLEIPVHPTLGGTWPTLLRDLSTSRPRGVIHAQRRHSQDGSRRRHRRRDYPPTAHRTDSGKLPVVGSQRRAAPPTRSWQSPGTSPSQR